MFITEWLGWLGVAWILTVICAVGGYALGSM